MCGNSGIVWFVVRILGIAFGWYLALSLARTLFELIYTMTARFTLVAVGFVVAAANRVVLHGADTIATGGFDTFPVFAGLCQKNQYQH